MGTGRAVMPTFWIMNKIDEERSKRSRWMAALLGLVALGVYLGFLWATANGY